MGVRAGLFAAKNLSDRFTPCFAHEISAKQVEIFKNLFACHNSSISSLREQILAHSVLPNWSLGTTIHSSLLIIEHNYFFCYLIGAPIQQGTSPSLVLNMWLFPMTSMGIFMYLKLVIYKLFKAFRNEQLLKSGTSVLKSHDQSEPG